MELFDLLQKIAGALEHLDIPYIVTGSVASMAYGEPRLTNDIDIVAAIEERHIAGLLSAFPVDEYYISEEMIREAIRHHGQFNIIHPASGLKVDMIIKQDTLFDRSRFGRVRRVYQANFSAPEDVIIKKMEFYREGGSEKHLRDITGILKVSKKEVDLDYISEWADRLELTEIWDALRKRLNDE